MPARFSSRLPFRDQPNALAAAIAARREPFVDLTESNPTRAAGIVWPGEALAEALAAGARAAARYEPAARGTRAAREAVAAHEGAAPDDLLLCASTSEAYSLLFKTLCDPGDVVLAPRPSYPLFDHLAALDGVRLATYPLVQADGWRADLGALAAALAAEPRARAILAVSPGNPTGAYLARDELEALWALAARHGAALVVDEVFERYPADDAPAPRRAARVARVAPVLTFTLSGLSKSCGLPQLKLGWIWAGGPAAERRDALARLELVADSYLSLGGPVQAALPKLLEIGAGLRAQILRRVRGGREGLAGAVAQAPAVSLLPAEGGWSAILRFPAVRSDEQLALALLERGFLVHPGHFFDLADGGTYVVLGLLAEVDESFVTALRHVSCI